MEKNGAANINNVSEEFALKGWEEVCSREIWQ